ncbi:FHA domain-containing protein [Methylobacter marinus]|uniref:FHA domain-containing protein n=1 Tax=Methylobacter marinus TaxID=34058 RepID=UPI0018DCA879|nr:FHA domain-containing protein [Methylobacter marinus]
MCKTNSSAMGYLNIYFNDELKSKHQVSALITRIGRHQDNDVVIDNAGVSGNHAEIIKNGDQYTIHDLDSKNGVYVNGERISKKELKFGDEIIIFKHRLRFIGVDLPVAVVTPDSTASIEKSNQSATVEVDVSKLETLLKEKEANNACLEVSSGAMAGRTFRLSKPRFSVGKSPDCDLQTGGWFAPQIAAKIVRQSDGYYLVPEKRGKTRHNGTPIKGRVKLKPGDSIEIRGIKLHFTNK